MILAEVQRIRVLVRRFIAFVAAFSLLVVLPAMALLCWASWLVVSPANMLTKAQLGEAKTLKKYVGDGAARPDMITIHSVQVPREGRYPIVESTSTISRKALPVEGK